MDYITYMRKQATLVSLPDAQTLQAILSGLDPHIRPFILQQKPTTISDLEECACRIADHQQPYHNMQTLFVLGGNYMYDVTS